MKKFIGTSIIVLAITIAIAIIPLVIFGNDEISRDHDQFLTGTILFYYILVLGICFLIFYVVSKYNKITDKDLPKVYQSITYIIISGIIIGGFIGLFLPKEMRSSSGMDPFPYYYEFNTMGLLIPIGLGVIISLIIYGNYISKK